MALGVGPAGTGPGLGIPSLMLRLLVWAIASRWFRRTTRPCDYCTGDGRGHDFDCETRQQH